MKSATISVVMTSYNQRAFLGKAIDSVLQQTYSPYELLIIDDASTDGSQTVIGEYSQQYPGLVKAFFNKVNQGVSATRNLGLNHVTGEFFTTLDGDDWYHLRKLEYELEAIGKAPQASIAYSNYWLTSLSGRPIIVRHLHPFQPTGNVFVEVLSAPALMRDMLVKTSCIEMVGGFDEKLNLYEDWEWKMRLTKNFEATYCPHPLLYHRKHHLGLASQSLDQHANLIEQIIEDKKDLISDVPGHVQRRVLRYIDGLVCERRAIVALQGGDRKVFLRYLRASIKATPFSIKNYRLLLLDLGRWIRDRARGR
jgi:glycosyltransferase involved in cell wall biosynthesis